MFGSTLQLKKRRKMSLLFNFSIQAGGKFRFFVGKYESFGFGMYTSIKPLCLDHKAVKFGTKWT